MATVHWEKQKEGIEVAIKAILVRTHSVSSYFNRVLMRQFQTAQIERWKSQNTTQGDVWKALTPEYAKQKKKKFASAPGGGNVVMIASGKLVAGAQARDAQYFMKKVTDQTFQISINTSAIPYAKYPGAIRPYMSFSQEQNQKWVDGLMGWVMKEKEPK